MEQWKPIEGYEGLYEISNLGKVKSLNYLRTGKEKMMSLNVTRVYYKVRLSYQSKRKNSLVHRLVALHFIPNPNNLPCVCHKKEDLDENGGLYNGYDNLFWGTLKDNAQDRESKGRSNSIFITNHPKNNLGKLGKLNHSSKKVYQYTLELELVRVWDSIADISREMGYYSSYISKCCLLKKNKYKGYKWSYTLI